MHFLCEWQATLDELFLDKVGLDDRVGVAADVVFVHGLGGSSPDSWQVGGDETTFWPRWLFEDLLEIQVWALRYPAHKFRWSASGADMCLPDRARSIIDFLASHDIGVSPVIFITHSLGGLLIKQILRLACEMHVSRWSEIAANTRGVVFLGTPHAGTGLANLGKALAFLGVSSSVAELVQDDPHLRDLNHWYRQNARAKGYETHAYFEKGLTAGVLIVDESSADPGVEGCIPIPFDGSHTEICKPRSRSSPVYVGVRSFVESLVGARGKDQPSERDIETVHEATISFPRSRGAKYLSPALADEMDFFTKRVDEDERLDLGEKLRLGGKAHEIQRAIWLKEQFAKQFTRNQLQPSAIRRYVDALAEVESRFNAHVYPEIVAGASRAAVADLVRTKVAEPILSVRREGDDLVNAVVIDRMIYYLTGLCHIRWHQDE